MLIITIRQTKILALQIKDLGAYWFRWQYKCFSNPEMVPFYLVKFSLSIA